MKIFFESEYFYYILIKYLLDTIFSLYNYEVLRKITLFKNIKNVTRKIKEKQIKERVILNYYYFVITEEYYLDKRILELLIQLGDDNDEENLLNYKYNGYYLEKNINENKLIVKKENQIIYIIDNYDNYIINEKIIKEIILKNKFSKSTAIYSLKGLLLNYDFKKEDGDFYWEEFLSSKLVEEILTIYYPKIDNKIYQNKEIRNIFKNNSYYYPIFNTSFFSLTQKELFSFYFSNYRAKKKNKI